MENQKVRLKVFFNKEKEKDLQSLDQDVRYWSGLRISILVLALLTAGILIYLGQEFVTIEKLKQEYNNLTYLYIAYPVMTVSLYMAVYILLVSISFPGSAPLSILAGGIFGTVYGSLMAVVCITVGGTFSFLLSRFLFRDFIEKRYHRVLKTIDRELKENGILYVLALRLGPVYPYSIINPCLGVTGLSLPVYMTVTFIGVMPLTFIYGYFGDQLTEITSVEDALSYDLMLVLTLIGLIPIVGKKSVSYMTRHTRRFFK